MLLHAKQVMLLMVIFVMLKWYKTNYYKDILSIYWMTLVFNQYISVFHYFVYNKMGCSLIWDYIWLVFDRCAIASLP